MAKQQDDLNLVAFGKRIKEIRKEKNLSYREMSLRCDIDNSDISKIEKGRRNIRISTIFELAKGLDVHPKVLFDFELVAKVYKSS